jgi:outer membrane lipoprotein carrier protein
MNPVIPSLALACFSFVCNTAHADAVDTLRHFIQEVKTGRAQFTQTVTSPDGVKKKTSSGNFEFSRPNRFKFNYTKPFDQLIVGDGQKVWIFDADLNQASSRKFSAALGATPAALLAGGTLDQDFSLTALPNKNGLSWVQANPKQGDGTFKSLQIGFRGKELAAVEILDAFNQRSVLQFSQFTADITFAADAFQYTPPAGVDVIEQ